MRQFYRIHNNKRGKKGFSLVELAVVISIISIFMAGILSAGISITDNVKKNVTQDKMEEIYNAMGKYLAINGRLPCPAPINVKKSDSEYGKDKASGLGACKDIASEAAISGVYLSSDLAYGMVPVKSLNLIDDMAEDGFGSKFAYVVNTKFTGFNKNGTSNNFTNAPFTTSITVEEVDSVTTTITNDAAFVIISYGPNKNGAFDANLTTQNPSSSAADEDENELISATYDTTFIARSEKEELFDDIVFFKTKKDIMLDFDAMHLVTCTASSTNNDDVYLDGSTTLATWPETEFGQIAVSNDSCAAGYNNIVDKPTKKCGSFGDWKVGGIDLCQ